MSDQKQNNEKYNSRLEELDDYIARLREIDKEKSKQSLDNDDNIDYSARLGSQKSNDTLELRSGDISVEVTPDLLHGLKIFGSYINPKSIMAALGAIILGAFSLGGFIYGAYAEISTLQSSVEQLKKSEKLVYSHDTYIKQIPNQEDLYQIKNELNVIDNKILIIESEIDTNREDISKIYTIINEMKKN